MSKVNINAGVISPFTDDTGIDPAFLCVVANRDFIAADGTIVLKGSKRNPEVGELVGVNLVGEELRIDAFSLEPTTNSSRPTTATYRAMLLDADLNWIRDLKDFTRFKLSHLTSPTTWEGISLFNASPTVLTPSDLDTVLQAVADGLAAFGAANLVHTLYSEYGNSLATAVSTIGATDTVLVIDRNTTVSADLTIPKNIHLAFTATGKITVAAGKTLTINSIVDPGLRKVLDVASTGAVHFTRGAGEVVRSAWWTGPFVSEIDITDVINQMLAGALASAGQILDFAHGVWLTGGGHTVPSRTIIKGAGWGLYNPQEETCFKLPEPGDYDYIFKVEGSTWDVEFRDFQIDGNSIGVTGVLLEGVAPNTSGNITFRRFGVGSCDTGVWYYASDNIWQVEKLSFEDVSFGDNVTANIRLDSPNSVVEIKRAFFTLLTDQVGIDAVCGPPMTIKNVEAAGTGGSSNTTMFKFGTLSNSDAVLIENYVDENITTSIEHNCTTDIEGILAMRGGGFGGKCIVNGKGRFAFSNVTMYSEAIVCNNDQALFAFDELCTIKGTDNALTPVTPTTPFDPSGTDRPLIMGLRDIKPNATFGDSVYKSMLPQRFWSPGASEASWADEPLVQIGVGPGTNRGLWIGAAGDLTPFNFQYGFHIYRDQSSGWLRLVADQGADVGYDFDQQVKLRGIIGGETTPAQITSNKNNYSPVDADGAAAHQTLMRVSSDAARDITGHISLPANLAGDIRVWRNVGTFNITLKHQSGSSTATNRFLSTTGQDVVLAPNETALAIYDGTTQRWILSKHVTSASDISAVPTTRKVNGQALSADVSVDLDLLTQRALGSDILTQTAALDVVGSSSSMSSGVVWISSIYLPKDATLTGIKWLQGTQGNYTGDSYNGLGLYSYSSGTLTLVASTTNDSEIWKATANAIASKAFSSTYAATAGVYFVAALYHSSAQTTAPTLARCVAAFSGSQVMDFTNSAIMQGSLSGQTAIPTPQAISGFTFSINRYWFALY